MQYAIVYSSPTGNTAQLAQAIREALPAQGCLYFGQPDPKALEAEIIYVGDFGLTKAPVTHRPPAFYKR